MLLNLEAKKTTYLASSTCDTGPETTDRICSTSLAAARRPVTPWWLMYAIVIASDWFQIRWPSSRMAQHCITSQIAWSAKMLSWQLDVFRCPSLLHWQGIHTDKIAPVEIFQTTWREDFSESRARFLRHQARENRVDLSKNWTDLSQTYRILHCRWEKKKEVDISPFQAWWFQVCVAPLMGGRY